MQQRVTDLITFNYCESDYEKENETYIGIKKNEVICIYCCCSCFVISWDNFYVFQRLSFTPNSQDT